MAGIEHMSSWRGDQWDVGILEDGTHFRWCTFIGQMTRVLRGVWG